MFPECSTVLEVQSYKEFRNIIKVMRVVCSRHAGIAVTPPFPHFQVFLEVALTELYFHYNNQRGPVWICHFTASNLNPSNNFYSLLSLESFTAQKLGKICLYSIVSEEDKIPCVYKTSWKSFYPACSYFLSIPVQSWESLRSHELQ